MACEFREKQYFSSLDSSRVRCASAGQILSNSHQQCTRLLLSAPVCILPADVFTCTRRQKDKIQVLVMVMLHPLNIFTNNTQKNPYSGADQRMCITSMLSSPFLSLGDSRGMILKSYDTSCDAGSVLSFLFCDVQCLRAVQMVDTANSSSQKSRWYFCKEDAAGTHRRD